MTDHLTPPPGLGPERRTALGSISPGLPRTISRSVVAHGSAGTTTVRATPMRAIAIAVVLAATVGLAAGWWFVAHRALAAAVRSEAGEQLGRAHRVFELVRDRTQDQLRASCRVLVEDPRLKSTLATGSVDEATVADILADLSKLRGSGFLIVLSPEGHVFAQAGADDLRGLDLSGSSVVKLAQASSEAVVGSWVIRGQVLDLGVMGVRFGSSVIAYLVVGQPVNQALLRAVADQTGVGIATATGTGVVLASSADDREKAALSEAAAWAGSFEGRLVEANHRTYAAAAFALEPGPHSEQRLLLARPVAEVLPSFETFEWLFRGVPLLMLVAAVFSMVVSRRFVVVTRFAGGSGDK